MNAFNDVVPVFNLPVFNVRRTSEFVFEQGERAGTGGSFIRDNKLWDLPFLHVVENFPPRTGMRLCCYDAKIDKNRRYAPCCRRPGNDKPSYPSPSYMSHQCATGKDRKSYASTSTVVFPFRADNAELSGKSWCDRHSHHAQPVSQQFTVADAVFAVSVYHPQDNFTLRMLAFEGGMYCSVNKRGL